MEKIYWLWNRLKCMSISEISYRMTQKSLSKLQQYGFFTANNPPEKIFSGLTKNWLESPTNVNLEHYLKGAEKISNGSLRVFSLTYDFNDIPNWNYDKSADKKTPVSFGKAIDYKDSELVGDIKYVWEPNRHLHLVSLAQAFSLSKNKKYSDTLSQHLSSWLDQCPYLQGLNWTSSLELGIRLINWSIVWQLGHTEEHSLFNKTSEKNLEDRWITSIYQHCHFINGHFSRHSSSNNHLIGEAAGLFIASITWPYWKESTKWRETSQKILMEEALKQNYSDGGNKEQAISYQQFVLDFLIFPGLAARSAECDFPQEYWDNIERMIEFIASIMDVKGNIPMIGDADDGYVSNLSQEPDFCPYQSLLATGSVLFNRADFKAKAGELDDKSKWLLGGDKAEKIFNLLSYTKGNLPIHKSFPETGCYIIGTDFENESEIKMLVDAGPLGYLSIAAHGHADALSFTLSVGGKEFLIDPGTYAYHTRKKWRDYFRGTSAHNTVRIDELDQSEPGGNFMWIKHANAECIEWNDDDDKISFSGKHDGYSRLDDPTEHSRKIKFDKKQKSFYISDTLQCKQTHTAERFWHFSEKCDVSITDDGSIKAIHDDKEIVIKPIQNVKVIMHRGDEEKPLGWVSKHYIVKEPATTVVWTNKIDGNSTLDAVIECNLT